MAIFTEVLLLEILGLITAFLAIIIVYYKWAFQYWRKRNVPYIEPSIPFGNFPNPLKSLPFLGEEMPVIYQHAKSKGWKYVGMYTMAKPLFMIVDKEILKYILIKDFNNFVDRGFYYNEKDDPISAHLFAIGGQKWKNLRAKLTPTFTSGKLKAMFQILINSGVALEKYFGEYAIAKQPIEAKDVLGSFTSDVISSCAFGLEMNSFKSSDVPLKRFAQQFVTPTKSFALINMFAQSCSSLAQFLGIHAVPKEVSEYFTKVVQDAVTYREKNNYQRKDFLQLLIDMKNNKELHPNGHKDQSMTVTMDEIIAQSFVFFLGGFETSATTVSFLLYELAYNLEIQDKVREEINRVLATHDNQITYDSISEMKYLRRVFDETLRKYPPVAFLTRVAGEDYKLPGHDAILEKGTPVIIPIRAYHKDPEYFPDPEVFDPERFTDENKNKRPQFAYMPFGGGPRICIGERFGIMQSRVALISILKNYKVTLNKEKTSVPLKMATNSMVPTALAGIWIDIEKI